MSQKSYFSVCSLLGSYERGRNGLRSSALMSVHQLNCLLWFNSLPNTVKKRGEGEEREKASLILQGERGNEVVQCPELDKGLKK